MTSFRPTTSMGHGTRWSPLHGLPSALALALVALGAVLIAVPFLYAVSTTLKPAREVLAIPVQWIPSQFLWGNFLKPFEQGNLGRYFTNSLFVGGMVTALNLITCPLAGYSFAKFHYAGRNTLFLIVLATLLVPVEVIYVPLYDLVFHLGWVNSYMGLIVPAGTSAFGIFLMRQTILAIPDELLDAARIDGASELRIYVRIVLPLLTPSLAVLAVFIFMNNWDSLLWPLLVASRNNYWTVPVGLAAMQANYSSDFAMLMAATFWASIPTLLVYFVLQRYFVAGIALSAGVRG